MEGHGEAGKERGDTGQKADAVFSWRAKTSHPGEGQQSELNFNLVTEYINRIDEV